MNQRVAIVTGGNKGIGFGLVIGLYENFEGIVYFTSHDSAEGEAALKSLQDVGIRPHFHQLDITDQASVDKFANHIQDTHGGFDILINNAGMNFNEANSEPYTTQVAEIIKINYLGTLRVCNALFPLLRPHGRVVNISSCCGHLSRIPSKEKRQVLNNPQLTQDDLTDLMVDYVKSASENRSQEEGWGDSAFCVSKVAVTALTFIQQRKFLMDLREDLIVNAVHPGYVDGVWTLEKSIDAPLYLAFLPQYEKRVRGRYVWMDRSIVDWTAPKLPN